MNVFPPEPAASGPLYEHIQWEGSVYTRGQRREASNPEHYYWRDTLGWNIDEEATNVQPLSIDPQEE